MRPLMNIRTFLKGGYRQLDGPTTIISGQTAIFIAVPIEPVSRPAHPEPEDAPETASTGGPEPLRPAGGQTEAPGPAGATVPPAGRSRCSPTRRSNVVTFPREGRG